MTNNKLFIRSLKTSLLTRDKKGSKVISYAPSAWPSKQVSAGITGFIYIG